MPLTLALIAGFFYPLFMRLITTLLAAITALGCVAEASIDIPAFLSQHDMVWDELTCDPEEPTNDGGLRTGYYAGAIMGNGLLGTNLYKLREGVYRLNTGRSDVTEARQPYNLYNSARLPIGYFTLTPVGKVADESMRLSLADATTTGRFTTDAGRIDFTTYVHSLNDYIIFDAETTGAEKDFKWDFTAQEAISPRHIFRGGAPEGYVNHQGKSNPEPERFDKGGISYLVQPLAADTTFTRINRYYVVAWKEIKKGSRRRIIATIAQQPTKEQALAEAKGNITRCAATPDGKLAESHKKWWHDFYNRAAFLSFPDPRLESFYWAQYYKFASTARPGKPVVDLQGVWPTWDTPWPAIWVNLNLQLTYSWLTKANLGELAEPLWDALYSNRANLTRNVTDIPGQESWTDAAVLPRTATYDFHAPLDPSTAKSNQYEVGNLCWTLFYFRQHCDGYGDTISMRERLFPLLKSAVNMFFHIRTEKEGRYSLPSTASPEYTDKEIGPNANYDLANLRWGLNSLIEIDSICGIGDPMRARWIDFRDNLVDYPYDEKTGFKVSDRYIFKDTTHRHYSHLFMIYPYHLLDWTNPADSMRMSLSLDRWNGNQGYSRTGKAAMLMSRGDGDAALPQLQRLLDRYVRPNTLYAETGPVIETPMAAVSTIHELYMQDWGDRIRVFHAVPSEWKDASFSNMRARGAFLVSGRRAAGRTVYVSVDSEKGGPCRIQTGINTADMEVRTAAGKPLEFRTISGGEGFIELDTKAGEKVIITDRRHKTLLPAPIEHNPADANPYGYRKANHSKK